MNVAREIDDAAAASLLEEMATMDAPSALKAKAARLAARCWLRGRSLSEVLEGAGLPAFAPGHPVVIYGWSMNDEESVEFARRLHSLGFGALIGVNQDWDETSARRFAEAHNLPGSQVYDIRGENGIIAWRLGLVSSSAVYVDSQGLITEPRVEHDTEAKLARSH